MSLMSKFRLASKFANVCKVPVRHGGHGPKMPIDRTDFMWAKFKDFLHFYVLLGVVPLTIITTYANIFIGQAELSEIPEGYTPHYYEYFKHPVSRFMAKYLVYDKARDYEMIVAKANEESENLILKNIGRELDALMEKNKDNKSFYYIPANIELKMHRYNTVKNAAFYSYGTPDSGLE